MTENSETGREAAAVDFAQAGDRPGPSPVDLETYIAASGRPADQTAGFSAWARSNSLGPLTMASWADAWKRFQDRPVR